MRGSEQTFNQQNENVDQLTTGAFYVRPASTSVGAVGGKENVSTTSRQSDEQPAGKGMNNGLTKALVGGLIGATLGTLAAALANKRTTQGVNHAAKGVGQAAKSVAEGVNHAAKGVGQAAKTVTEGVNYAVLGAVADVVKDTADNAKQAVESVAQGNREIASGEARTGKQAEMQTTYILVPVEKEQIIERTNIVEPETPVFPGATSLEEEVGQMQIDEQTSGFSQSSEPQNFDFQ